jgi:hypothetical protein
MISLLVWAAMLELGSIVERNATESLIIQALPQRIAIFG